MTNYKNTMTVGEVIEHLKKYDTKTPFVTTWEGTLNAIKKENFEIDKGWGMDVLFLDVDNHL